MIKFTKILGYFLTIASYDMVIWYILSMETYKHPLRLEIGAGLIPLVDKEKNGDLPNMIMGEINKLGLFVPPIHLCDNSKLDGNEYCIKLNETVIGHYKIKPDSFLCINPGSLEYEIRGEKTTEPAFGLPAIWISADDKEKAEQIGYAIVDPKGIITTHIIEICK